MQGQRHCRALKALTPTVNQSRLKLDGAMYAIYNFDEAGRLANIVNSGDSTTISFVHDNADRMTSRVYPNGITTTYEYDGMSRLTRLKDTSATATLFDRQYSYNTANQISQIVEPSVSRTFASDNIDRLLSVTNPTSGNESYLFDVVGNRTSSHRSNTYSYQPFNRVTSTQTATYAYDSNGNMVSKSEGSKRWKYAWDYENRMTSVSDRKTRQRQVYDALGRRVMTYGGPKGSTKYTYDGLDVVMDDDSVSGITKYQDGLGIDDKLKLTNGGTTKYFLQDHLGSTVALTNSSGAVTEQTTYDSFGNQTSTLSTHPISFHTNMIQ